MKQLGQVMASEIAQTPQVFATILDNKALFDGVKNTLVIAISQSGQSPDLVAFTTSAMESLTKRKLLQRTVN